MMMLGGRPTRRHTRSSVGHIFVVGFLTTLLICATHALTQQEIDTLLDGNIIVGNRASGGKIQIFPANNPAWNQHNVLWEYDTQENVDGLTMKFDHINDVKRVRYNNAEHVLIAGNGPGIALFDLHQERFVFSYRPRVPAGSRCSLKSLSIHSAEILPDGNFAVADPTGDDRGGASVRLIHGSTTEPTILQSLPFSGAHAVVWDYQRQVLWAWGGSKLKKYRYQSVGKDSALIQVGLSFKSPDWITAGHDMMPYGKDALIFNCAEGLGVFHIEQETFELLYGSIDMATNFIFDEKIKRGKAVDFNYKTGQIIQNLYEGNTVRSPNTLRWDRSMVEWSYEPNRDMQVYKSHWFVHNEFSYGPKYTGHLQPFSQARNRAGHSINRRPQFIDGFRRKAIVTAGQLYKRNIRKQSSDPTEADFKPIYEKVCGPSWLSINRAGMIFGTPSQDNVDDDYRTMLIRVSDRDGLSDVAEFHFRVEPPETSAPSPDPTARPTLPPSPSPTVKAPESSAPTNHPTTDLFTQRSNDFEELIYFSKDLVGPRWSSENLGPFGRCAGDCDADSDCMPGLLCKQRSGLDNNVPGCGGIAVEHVDYCYDPLVLAVGDVTATIPAIALTTDPPSKRPTPIPSKTPTQTPTDANTDAVWDAFMAMVNRYANAKNRLGEDSPEPSPESPSPVAGAEVGKPTTEPTTAFQAEWNESMERWKSSRTVQKGGTGNRN